MRLKVFFVPFGRPPQANEGSSSHPETKPSSFSLKDYICVFHYVLCNPHLTQEEVRVFLLWCSFHKFIKWQSPVNVEHMTSVEIYCCLRLCVYIYHCEDMLALCSFKELCDIQSCFNKNALFLKSSTNLCVCARQLTCRQSSCEGNPSGAPWTHESSPPCLLLFLQDSQLSTSPGRDPETRLWEQPVDAAGITNPRRHFTPVFITDFKLTCLRSKG